MNPIRVARNPLDRELSEMRISLGIGVEEFKRVDLRRRQKILQAVKRHFLKNPDLLHWWKAFRYPFSSRTIPTGHFELRKLCPDEPGKVWFIPCQEPLVYDTTPTVIQRISDVAAPFDFAVVQKKLEWLLVKTTDKRIFAVGARTIELLRG